MALDDPLITFAEYAERTDYQGTADQVAIEETIRAVSRHIERALGRSASWPRVFNATGAGTAFLVDGTGCDVLDTPDFTTLTAIAVDESLDGTYSTALTLADAWVQPEPYEADQFNAAYTRLRLLPLAGATLVTWPPGRANVRLTGTFGWPQVPEPVKEAVVMITRHVRDLEESGFTLTLNNMDAGIQMSPGANRLLRDLKAQYSLRVPGLA